jgi:hypothetical protein
MARMYDTKKFSQRNSENLKKSENTLLTFVKKYVIILYILLVETLYDPTDKSVFN